MSAPEAAASSDSARARSRSPRGDQGTTPPAPSDAGTTASTPPSAAVPASWMTPAPAAEATATATPPAKRKGGKGKKGAGPIGSDFGGIVDEKKEEKVTTTSLLSMAANLEKEGDEEKPTTAQIVEALRQAAGKMGALEKQVGEMGQTLQTVHMLTGKSMEGFSDSSRMASIEVAAGKLQQRPVTQFADDDEDGQSFMVKKGDKEMQEAHEKAQEKPKVVTGSGTAGGSGAAGKTREEMEAARKARLAALEASQNAKSAQIVEAEKKKKAHDALFDRQFVGPNKPLGTFK